MGVDRILGALLAWLATCAIHSTVLIAAAWALGAALARIAQDRASLAAARERLWKLAIFGGIATATLSAAGAGTWRVHLDIPVRAEERSIAAPSFAVVLPSSQTSIDLGNDPGAAESGIAPVWIEIVAALWFLGVAVGATAWLRDRRRLHRRLRTRERIQSGPALDRLADLRRRSSAPSNAKTAAIEVLLSRAPALAAPITLGILRPEICIPPRAETDLMPDELEAMLAHELAHAWRRDPLLLALCRAVEVVLFFQPLVRFARARLQDEVEILCDERAARWTGDPASLASCLAEVATWIVAGSSDLSVLSMAARGSRLALRVRSLLGDHKEDREGRSKGRRAWLSAAATFALAAAPLAAPAVSMEADPGPRPSEAKAPAATAPDASIDIERAARELTTTLDALESEWTAITSDPTLAKASAELRGRVARIETRLRTLRVMRARLDILIAEEVSAERQQQR